MTSPHTDHVPPSASSTVPRLTVLVASLREDRIGAAVAQWAVHRARSSFDVTVVDLAQQDLPEDRLLQPGGSAQTPMSSTLDAADAFLIVTPEYNHSYPAGLKRAIDWHYSEWAFKAASVVSYGAQGGLLATEHLRGVFAELHVVTTRRVVGLRAPWNDIAASTYTAATGTDQALDASLHELAWWAQVLRSARTEHPFHP